MWGGSVGVRAVWGDAQKEICCEVVTGHPPWSPKRPRDEKLDDGSPVFAYFCSIRFPRPACGPWCARCGSVGSVGRLQQVDFCRLCEAGICVLESRAMLLPLFTNELGDLTNRYGMCLTVLEDKF